MDYLAAKAAVVNSRTPDGRQAPTSPLRSGSPASAESWSSLGRNGQAFVADGSSPAAIAAATGRPAREPIRVYAGLSGGRPSSRSRRLSWPSCVGPGRSTVPCWP